MRASDETPSDVAGKLTYRMSPSEPPSQAVLKAIAEVMDSSVIGSTDNEDEDVLNPLYEAIDPEALDDLFQLTSRGKERSEGQISFVYEDCEVEVYSRGIVKVQQKQEY